MTDEELAEEWIKDHSGLIGSYEFVKYDYDSMKQAFLAGLKAQTKWHKVADGDLPKENKIYFVAIKDNGLAIAYFNGRHWETKYNLGDFGHCVEIVIAWCEIPKYTKE